jgi:hypothetical protein
MKTYTVLFAEDVPHYGTAEIQAENDAAAIEAAKAYDLSAVTTDAEWGNSACKRIVDINRLHRQVDYFRVGDYTPAMFVADRVTLRSLLRRADSFLPGPLASHQDRQ